LEATRVSDGDVLSIGQSTFYVESGFQKSLAPHRWVKNVLEVLDDVKQGSASVENVERLLFLERTRNFEQLCIQFMTFLQQAFPIKSAQLWTSSSQSYSDLQRQAPRVVEDVSTLGWISKPLEQLIWNEQCIVSAPKKEFLTTPDEDTASDWVTIVPIVHECRNLGLVICFSAEPAQHWIASMVMTLHWYTREWSVLEPWSQDRFAQVPFVTSLQWMLANNTADLDLSDFQHRHNILRAILRYLIRDFSWSSREVYLVESVMVLVDSGLDSQDFNEKLKWFEQSGDPFVRALVSMLHGVLRKDTSDERIAVLRLTLALFESCYNRVHISPSALVMELSKEHDLQTLSFTASNLMDVFQLVQRLEQQSQETQIFTRSEI
jgi:hypothetical protein